MMPPKTASLTQSLLIARVTMLTRRSRILPGLGCIDVEDKRGGIGVVEFDGGRISGEVTERS